MQLINANRAAWNEDAMVEQRGRTRMCNVYSAPIKIMLNNGLAE